MTSFIRVSGVVLLAVAMATALPRPDQASRNNEPVKNVASLSVGVPGNKTRQLASSNVPVASSDLVSGAANAAGLSSPALALQLQTALNRNPTNALAEINAEKQETATLQVQKQQQAMLAAIQAQQQQMAAAQYALSGQRPGATYVGASINRPTGANLQAQQQLMEQQQKLKIQQELLQKQQNPNAMLAGQQQNMVMAQLLSNPNPANLQQQLEQIRQQQSKQQAALMFQSQYPGTGLSSSAFPPSLNADISRNGVVGQLALQNGNSLGAMMPLYEALQQRLVLRRLLLLHQLQSASLLGLYGK